MENWGEFYDSLRVECNKGPLYDSIFQEKTFQALRAIEQNWTYRWMEHYVKLKIDLNADNPQVITLPAGFKQVLSIKLLGESGDPINLVELSAEQFVGGQDGTPSGYFIQGGKYLWLDKNPAEAYDVFLIFARFTLKTELDASLSHLILENGAACLQAATMINLSPTAREPAWIELYTPIYQTGLHTLHVWDEESRMADNVVVFGGGGGAEG